MDPICLFEVWGADGFAYVLARSAEEAMDLAVAEAAIRGVNWEHTLSTTDLSHADLTTPRPRVLMLRSYARMGKL